MCMHAKINDGHIAMVIKVSGISILHMPCKAYCINLNDKYIKNELCSLSLRRMQVQASCELITG